MIGVDEEIANNDAEGIEHHLHHETLKKIGRIHDCYEKQMVS